MHFAKTDIIEYFQYNNLYTQIFTLIFQRTSIATL